MWVWARLKIGLVHVFEKRYGIEVKGNCAMEESKPAMSVRRR